MVQEKYDLLAERILCKGSKLIPELFKMIADEKEADLLLALPGTSEEIAKKLNADKNEIEKMLDKLFLKGLVFKSKRPEGTKYRMCRDLVQFHDATILWKDAPKEFLKLWRRYMEEEWPSYSKMVEKFFPKPFTRVIPIEKSISVRQQVLSAESAREIVNNANVVSLTKCTCRLISGAPCKKPIEVCLQVGKAAEYNIERGTGKRITKEEAFEVLRKAEDAGLVHLTINKSKDFTFICNCCGDCCQSFELLIKEGRKLADPSRFCSKVDEANCNGCEACIERCYFGAIKMVSKNGKEIAETNPEKCMGCGLCAIVCPTSAIKLVEVRKEDFIPV